MELGPGIDDPDDEALVAPDPSQLAGTHGHPCVAVPGEDADDVRHPEVVVRLTGGDGNAFAVLGAVRRALREAGHADEAAAFVAEATSGDYHHLLRTCMRWVTVR